MSPSSQSNGCGPGYHGIWFTTFGMLSVDEDNGVVQGTYTHQGGRIQGRREGKVLRGIWAEPGHGERGTFAFTLGAGHNTFEGSWTEHGGKGTRGGWSGVRIDLPSEEAGGSPAGWNSHEDGPLLAGPMLGEVSETSARVWAQARDGSPLTLTVYRADGSTMKRVASPAWEEWCCVVFTVEDLSPGEAYEYAVEGSGQATPRYRLRTAPPRDARRLRVTFGSCFDDYRRDLPIFDAIRREESDIFLMLGDNCYFLQPDWQSEHTMMLAQLRNRNNPAIRRLLPEVPVLGIWDDHDFGPNDSDGRFPGKDSALRVFKRMWAQRAYGTVETVGIFSAVRVGPVALFLLDGRYHRVENREILGRGQLQWLLDRLAESDAPIKLIVSGSQVLPEATVPKGWECWRKDAPGELEALLSGIEQRGIEGVLFVSGDVHLGYLIRTRGRALSDERRGPEFWELTSSPLANHPWTERLVGAGLYDPSLLQEEAVPNYGVVDIDLDRAGREIILSLRDERGGALFTQSLSCSALATRPRVRRAAQPSAQVFGEGEADAQVVWNNGKAYVFHGNGYTRYDLASRRPDPGYPRYIAANWRGLFASDIDAAVVWNNGKAYFFKGSYYVRYDIAADRADPGYPKRIADHWPGLFPEGIEAAMLGEGGKAYFFKGDQVIRYDVAADRADPGYPRPVGEVFPGGGVGV
jgi:alkaline phosphatase D